MYFGISELCILIPMEGRFIICKCLWSIPSAFPLPASQCVPVWLYPRSSHFCSAHWLVTAIDSREKQICKTVSLNDQHQSSLLLQPSFKWWSGLKKSGQGPQRARGTQVQSESPHTCSGGKVLKETGDVCLFKVIKMCVTAQYTCGHFQGVMTDRSSPRCLLSCWVNVLCFIYLCVCLSFLKRS